MTRTLDQWITQARCSCFDPDRPDFGERVGRRAFALQEAGSDRACIWHAAHEVYVEDLAAGLIAHGTCTFCGGRTLPSQNNAHALCEARWRRGLDRPERLDSMARDCDCHPCRVAAGAR